MAYKIIIALRHDLKRSELLVFQQVAYVWLNFRNPTYGLLKVAYLKRSVQLSFYISFIVLLKKCYRVCIANIAL